MAFDHDPDFPLLARYLAGEVGPAEREAVEAWAAADPEHAQELAEFRRWWAGAGSLPTPHRVDAMWGSLQRKIREADPPAAASASVMVRRSAPVLALPRRAPEPRNHWWAVAAAVVGVAAVGGWATLRGREPIASAAHVSETPAQRFATRAGQRTELHLPDGSRVELGYASTLRVAIGTGRRELWLDGEATFDVVHDSTRPFIVHAGGATTEDLGTSFAIRAYGVEPGIRVVVMAGSVALRADGGVPTPRTVLVPGEVGRIHADGRFELERGADTAAFVGWREGRVSFRQEPLAAVARELERRFDVPVRVTDPALAAKRVTIDMPARVMDEVLDAVAIAADARHRREGASVLFER